MKLIFTTLCLAMLLTGTTSISASTTLNFSFYDPTGDWLTSFEGPGDHTPIDLTRLVFEFDNTTGQYSTRYDADPIHPFIGYFRLNTNLFNPDTGSTDYNPSFFADTANDFNLAAPTTTIVLTGVNSNLLSWHVGDRVAVSGPDPLGLPTNSGITAFASGVNVPGGWCTLPCARPGFQDNLEGFTTINAVPIPATFWLFTSAIAGIAVLGQKRKV